jgi:uncharacterized protein YgiM (DUF1202 family)
MKITYINAYSDGESYDAIYLNDDLYMCGSDCSDYEVVQLMIKYKTFDVEYKKIEEKGEEYFEEHHGTHPKKLSEIDTRYFD